MDPLGPAIVVVGAAVAVCLVVWGYRRQKRRLAELAAVAASLGLTFSVDDQFAIHGRPFALFARGDRSGCENGMWGRLGDHTVAAFEVWCETTHVRPKGIPYTTREEFSAAIVPVPMACPHVTIEPETFSSRVADALGRDDIAFESEEFNRAFEVHASDRRFASYLIDARMMEWLMEAEGPCWEIHDGEILCYASQLRPAELPQLIDLAVGFRERVPRAALDVYRGA